jgi:hypothetical protein
LHGLPSHLADYGLSKMLDLVGKKVLGMGGNSGHEKKASTTDLEWPDLEEWQLPKPWT